MIRIFYLVVFLVIGFLGLGQEVNLTDSNLPIFIIDTQGESIPNEPKIDASLGIINNPQQRNYLGDPFTDYDGKIGIEIRGNGTSGLDKASYLFETRNQDGSNNNVELLGMPSENDWILYSPYYDKSLIRNVLTYRIADEMGLLSSRTKFCELIINGEYRGVYVLMEKIKRDKNRVDVKEFDINDNEADQGGYIARIDSWWSPSLGWTSNEYVVNTKTRQVYYQYVYPKHDEITEEQKEFIQEKITEFEETLYYAEQPNAHEQYLELIDINSFVDFLLINEFGKNPDAYRLSTYLYYDPTIEDPKITMGPVWDHNFCYGNYPLYENKFTRWEFDNHWWDPGTSQIPFWWDKLMNDSLFISTLNSRWNDHKLNLFNCNSIEQRIDDIALFLDEAQERNFQKWDILGKNEPWDWNAGPTYADELNYLKTWICNRIEWMDNKINRIANSFESNFARLFPNPSNNIVNVDLRGMDLSESKWEVDIINIHSLSVKTTIVYNYSGFQTPTFDVSGIEAGIYFVHFSNGKSSFIEKLIIQ